MNPCLVVLLLVGPSCVQPQAPRDDQRPREEVSSSVLAGGWMEEWEHRHSSPSHTPFVHAFGMEPAFLGRDLLVDYRRTTAKTETEDELDVELEWAVTRRVGFAIGLPVLRLDENAGGTHGGVGDLGVAPRALLVDNDSFLLAASLEVTAPTGDEDRGLGGGETGLGPSLALWADLGNWITFQGRVGTEHGLESGDSVLVYNTVLMWSFSTSAAHSDHAHHEPRLATLIGELAGRTVLHGEHETRTTAELLFGVSYSLTEHWEIRGGYEFPIGGPQDMQRSFVLGVVHHF